MKKIHLPSLSYFVVISTFIFCLIPPLLISPASSMRLKNDRAQIQNRKHFNHPKHSPETKPSHNKLNFLYHNAFGKTLRTSALNKPWFSKLAGWYADSPLSRYHIKPFIKTHNIDMSQTLAPVESYTCFNDFFTRKLKPEARPLASSEIISPADGALTIIAPINAASAFCIKNALFNLEQFLGNAHLAKEFDQGTMLIVRLAPWDYHRFHYPVTGYMSEPHRIKGIYESVDPQAFSAGIQPLTSNERQYTRIKTTSEHECIMIAVGAMCVGKIIFTHTPHALTSKGIEAGYFAFGGSTIVLLFKSDFCLDPSLAHATTEYLGDEIPVKMGQALGTWR